MDLPDAALPEKGDGGLEQSRQRDLRKTADVARRAIRARWAIPEEMKLRVVDVCGELLESVDARCRATAMKTLAELEKMNQADEHLAEKQKVATAMDLKP